MLRSLVLLLLLLSAPWLGAQGGFPGGGHLTEGPAEISAQASRLGSAGISLGFLLPAWHSHTGALPQGIGDALSPELSDSELEESEFEESDESRSQVGVRSAVSLQGQSADLALARLSSKDFPVHEYPLASLIRLRSERVRAGLGLRGPPLRA